MIWQIVRAYWTAHRKGLMDKYGKTTILGIIAGALAIAARITAAAAEGMPINWGQELPEILAIVAAVGALIRLRLAVQRSGPPTP